MSPLKITSHSHSAPSSLRFFVSTYGMYLAILIYPAEGCKNVTLTAVKDKPLMNLGLISVCTG